MKISPSTTNAVIHAKTKQQVDLKSAMKWWEAGSQSELTGQILGTVAFLKENTNYRQRQAAIYARLYGNQSLFSFAGTNMSKLDQMTGLPQDRPTFNLIQSAVDTLVARIGQSKPQPTFLTDNS